MKKILFIGALIATAFTSNIYAQDTAKPHWPDQLLVSYYHIKNALVESNSSNAATSAAAFIKTANTDSYKAVPEDNLKALVKDAAKIAETKSLEKQREYFSGLSSNMATVAKAIKLSDQPIYQQYCPMKKANWLSSEKAIKNPYYGSSMLTCGRVSGTL